jgi:mutator protein MutT
VSRRRVRVVAALIRRAGRVLVSQRLAGKHLAGLWEFPGGKPEVGESDDAALRRELEEELGLRACQVGARVAVVEHAYPEFDLELGLWAVETTETPEVREVAAVDWVDVEALARLPMPPADVPLVAAIQALEAQPKP